MSPLISDGPREVIRVGKWPGLPDQRGLTKIPSLVYYNRRQEVRQHYLLLKLLAYPISYVQPMKFGAEAATADAKDDAEDEDWELAQHFKLHLHPYELRTKHKLETPSKPIT